MLEYWCYGCLNTTEPLNLETTILLFSDSSVLRVNSLIKVLSVIFTAAKSGGRKPECQTGDL